MGPIVRHNLSRKTKRSTSPALNRMRVASSSHQLSSSKKQGRLQRAAEGAFNLFFSPLWQYALLAAIFLLYFLPGYPHLVSFAQGFLLTAFVTAFSFVWFFGKFAASEKKEQLRVDSFAHPVVTTENIEFVPKPQWEEMVYMNMWPQDREPYTEETYNVKETKSVLVVLGRTHVRVDQVHGRIPTQQMYHHGDLDPKSGEVQITQRGRELPLAAVNVFLSPEGLPQTRWFKRKYPIVIQSGNKAVDDTGNYHYLFARTNRDKEVWFNKLYDAVAVAKGARSRTHDENYRIYMHNMYKDIMRGEMREDIQLLLINKFLARAWYNLQTSRPFNHYMRMKLTKNLRKLKVAKYFYHVGIQELKMGDKFPFVTKIRDVGHNKWGMWFEMDMDFVGRVLATIRTRGIRIPSKALEETQNERSRALSEVSEGLRQKTSSDDDDTGRKVATTGQKTGVQSEMQKFLVKFLVDMPWVKNTIGNKPIMLHLCLKRLRGRIMFNLPVPPTDRLWYGFRHSPSMDVEIYPCLGECCKDKDRVQVQTLSELERGVLGHLMTAMEERMKLEIEKNWVDPNMGNLVLPYFKVPPWLEARARKGMKEEEETTSKFSKET